jgi:hypothetical protein
LKSFFYVWKNHLIQKHIRNDDINIQNKFLLFFKPSFSSFIPLFRIHIKGNWIEKKHFNLRFCGEITEKKSFFSSLYSHTSLLLLLFFREIWWWQFRFKKNSIEWTSSGPRRQPDVRLTLSFFLWRSQYGWKGKFENLFIIVNSKRGLSLFSI